MKNPLKILFLVYTTFFFTACANRIGDFTLISTKNVDISRLSAATVGKTRVSGKDTKHIVVVFPTGIPNLKEAVDRAIESHPDCVALSNAVIYHHFFYIPYIFGEEGYSVEGNPVALPAK
jgi:hypothetical protein